MNIVFVKVGFVNKGFVNIDLLNIAFANIEAPNPGRMYRFHIALSVQEIRCLSPSAQRLHLACTASFA